jgi:hypothetical protein
MRLIASLAMGTLLFTACSLTTNLDGLTGGAATAGPDGAACAPNVTGHWAATVSVAVLGALKETVAGQVDLQQDCTAVTGSMSLQACITGGKVEGTVDDGGSFNATITSGSLTATANGTVTNANEIDGDFTLAGGGSCPVQGGTFQLRRQ